MSTPEPTAPETCTCEKPDSDAAPGIHGPESCLNCGKPIEIVEDAPEPTPQPDPDDLRRQEALDRVQSMAASMWRGVNMGADMGADVAEHAEDATCLEIVLALARKADWLEDLTDESLLATTAALRARIEELEGALDDYGSHSRECRHPGSYCTCGLAVVRNARRTLEEGDREG